jgi:hypothetical protein
MDEWIDRAISSYIDAEAPPGMEQRILVRARASKTRLTPWLLVPAAVCLVWAWIILLPKQPQPVPQIHAAMALPRVRSQITSGTAPLVREPRRHQGRLASLPKRATFPAASRVPDPELALARLSLANPGLAQALLAEPDTGEPKPIHIEPLSIKLLDED